jgi:hypothetical protein
MEIEPHADAIWGGNPGGERRDGEGGGAAGGGIRSNLIFNLGEILEFYFPTNFTLGPAAWDTSKDVGSTDGHNAQSVNVVSDAGLPRLAMQARFCDTTAFGRPATEGERAGGKCNGGVFISGLRIGLQTIYPASRCVGRRGP